MNTRRRLCVIVLGVLLVSLSLFFTELDRLVSQVATGQGFSILDVTSIAAMAHTQQWEMGWSTSPSEWRVEPFIRIYAVLDVAFVIVYSSTLLVVIDRILPPTRGRQTARLMLALLVAADVIENILLLVMGAAVQSETPPSQEVPLLQVGALLQAAASVVKWILVLCLIAHVLRQPGLLAAFGRGLRRALRAAAVQRLSLFVVVVLGALTMLPLHPILEQVPDIQRSWLDADKWHGGVIAALVLATLSVAFWFLGRAMAERSVGVRHPRTGANYLVWLALPAVVLVTGLVVDQLSKDGERLLDHTPFRIFLGVSTLAVLVSASPDLFGAVRRRGRLASLVSRSPGSPSPQPTMAKQPAPALQGLISVEPVEGVRGSESDARWAGAILSALIIALPAVGLARSVSTQVLLALSAPPVDNDFAVGGQTIPTGQVLLSSVIIVLMMTLAVCALFVATGDLVHAMDPTLTRLTESPRWRVGSGVMAALLIVGLVAMQLWPARVGHAAGPVAVTIGALGAQVALIGLLSVTLSYRAPLRVFRWLGLRSDPVVALFVAVPVLISQLAGTPTLHSIERLNAPVTSERDSLEVAFHDWLDRNKGCVAEVHDANGSPVAVRPLVLIAAEGGGIRAAVWTVAALSELVSSGKCAANSVFLSSGVSGGSLGLAIAANPPWDADRLNAADPNAAESMAGELRQAAHSLGTSTALATAVHGLLVSDPIASTTGVRMPSLESGGTWRDRASLIEHSWRTAHPPLIEPFDADAAAPTGLVVLNSTDIRSGCRAVISQVELGPGQTGGTDQTRDLRGFDPAAECHEGIAEPALTIDVLDRFERCSRISVDWATAGLLSARFPIVTPSGTVGSGRPEECSRPRLQLVDGGYAENSGLGLLADTAPSLGRIIRDHNTLQRALGDPLVVPYVMYIQNSAAPIFEPSRDTAELLVPLAGLGAKKTQVAPSSWIQRILGSVTSLCNASANAAADVASDSSVDCASSEASMAWNAEATRRVVVVQAETQPSILVPLGWGLSDASYCQLVLDADQQASLSSKRPFEFNNTLGNYLRLFDDQAGGAGDSKCPAR